MRPFTLTAVKTGISRLRTKGGARPDALYDLVNAQMNAAKEIIPRPGNLIFEDIENGDETKGLAFFLGLYHVFADHFVDINSETTILHVLPNPDADEPSPPTLVDVTTSEPFLGYLFVVAKYSNGDIFYFWLTEGANGGTAWLASHVYRLNEMVRPTVPNGYYYRATRLNPPGDVWTPGATHEIGDIVEPTKFNGFQYVAIDVIGTAPRSGTVEPNWPEEEDALTYEDADTGTPPPTTPTGGGDLPPDIDDRYNRFGVRKPFIEAE